MSKRKKVALGKPIEVTEEQLELLAMVTPEDIERAKQMPGVTARMKALLSSDKAEGEDEQI